MSPEAAALAIELIHEERSKWMSKATRLELSLRGWEYSWRTATYDHQFEALRKEKDRVIRAIAAVNAKVKLADRVIAEIEATQSRDNAGAEAVLRALRGEA